MVFEDFKKQQREHQPNALDFEYCTGYLRQATRNGCFERTEDDTSIIWTRRQPNKDRYVIVASSGKNRVGIIESTSKELAKESEKDVVVKNVGRDLEVKLKASGFEDYRDDERWDYSKYDDNTYPQQIVDTEKCSSLEGPKYSSLREELMRFRRKVPIKVVPYKSKERVKSLLERWAEQMSRRDANMNYDELIRSHEDFIESNTAYLQFEILNPDSVVGFISLSEISRRCMGFNALINDFSYRNLYRAIMFEGIKIVNEHGYHFVNLQGSEDEDQHKSKRRFKAGTEIPKKHLVYRV